MAGQVTITGDLTGRAVINRRAVMPTKTCLTFGISVLAHTICCLLLYTDMPSLHRRSNHPRWVLTGDLTTVEETVV